MMHVLNKEKLLWVSLGRNQYWAGTVYDLCVYFMTRAPEGSTESVSGEAGNRTCDPGLHGI